MKSFKLVVTLVLLTGFLTVSVFAKSSTRGKTAVISKPGATATVQTVNPKTSGLADDQGVKHGQLRTVSEAISAPAPTKIEKEAFTKMYGAMSLTGLSGTYHIPGDFPSISTAVAVLNYVGVTGNVTFELDAASLTEQNVTFGSYTGNGSYTVTVKPQAGLAVTVTFIATPSAGKGFAFNGAKNVVIDGLNSGGASLTLNYNNALGFPLADVMASTIYITGGSSRITVKNASLTGNVNDPVWANQTEGRSAIFMFGSDADPAANHNITLDHLTITGATYGIKTFTGPLVTNNSVDTLAVTNCNIGGAFGDPVAMGGWYEYTAHVTFAYNVVDGVEFLAWYWNNPYTEYDDDVVFGVGQVMFNFGYTTGEYFALTDAMVFHDNIIRNVSVDPAAVGLGLSTYAVRIYDNNRGYGVASAIFNNRIYNISNPGSGALTVGFRGPAGNFYYNSIQLTGPSNGNTATCYNGGGGTAYNNAFSMEMTGGTAAHQRAFVAGGTIDHNAAYSTGQFAAGYSVNAAVALGLNPHGVFGPVNFTSDLHLDPAGPSAAENIGMRLDTAKGRLSLHDIDGDLRDTSAAGHTDAGADEVSAALASQLGVDVFPVAVTVPLPAGVPAGLAVTPVVYVKNNSNSTTAGFNLELDIADAGPYSSIVAIPSLPPLADSAINTFTSWNPAAGGPWNVTATTSLSGDITIGNDTIRRTQTAQAPAAIVNDTTITWDGGATDWTHTNDWVLSNTFTKLGGPYSGKSWVTQRPNDASTYTEGANASSQGYSTTYPGANVLTSPWLSLSGMPGTDLYISFVQSINTEPGWDGSWWEYTVDGVNWLHLGALNDVNGINWYSQAVYANAQSYIGDPPDTSTMKMTTYLLYGPGTGVTSLPMSWWTSNGNIGVVGTETGPQGPNGWVYNQLKVTAVTNHILNRAPVVKFRYIAFSDALTAYAGWAIDNFRLAHAGTTFTGGTITGTVFEDVNGNGVNDAEPLQANMKVYLSYFGVLKDSTTTNVSGVYSFNIGTSNSGLPGVYNITVINHAGWGFSVPAAYPHVANVNHPSDGSTMTQDIGLFNGNITGKVFSDVNDNGVLNIGEPGLAGYTVTVYRDTINGLVAGQAVTDVNGAYTIGLPNYSTYIVAETFDTTTGRMTYPKRYKGYDTLTTLTHPSGDPGSFVTNVNFGDFLFATFSVAVIRDLNGNGIMDPADVGALDAPTIGTFNVTRNGAPFAITVGKVKVLPPDTVGGGAQLTLGFNLGTVDTGTYVVSAVYLTPGWVWTTPSTYTTSLYQSGMTVIDTFLASAQFNYSGNTWSDLNGNGTKNVGEPPLVGWTVNLQGIYFNGLKTTTTDTLGNYTFTGLRPDKFHVSLALPTGWIGIPPYLTDSISYANRNTGINKNLAAFKTFTISGTVYRDANVNGVRDPGEPGIVHVVNLKRGATTTPVTPATDGTYSFTNVGVGGDTVSEVTGGLLVSQPLGNKYAFLGLSGVNVTGEDFGNYLTSDTSYMFRTFTALDLFNVTSTVQKKIVRVKKAPVIAPNLLTLLGEVDVVVGKPDGYMVGLAAKAMPLPSLKMRAYIQPSTYTDLLKSFAVTITKVLTAHTGTPRGLDLQNDETKALYGKYASIGPGVQNNLLIADLMALAVNVELSGYGRTPVGFGQLTYSEPGNALSGLSVQTIMQNADSLVTFWNGVPLSVYANYDYVIAKIDSAFANGHIVFGLGDTNHWQSSTTLDLKGVKPVSQVPFLIPNPQLAPRIIPLPTTAYVAPTAYALLQNYPNPFNPTTSIPFDLPQQSVVTLKIYNMLGQEVATLIDHQLMDADRQEVTFDASNLPSGVYFYRVMATGMPDGNAPAKTFMQVKKMMLLK